MKVLRQTNLHFLLGPESRVQPIFILKIVDMASKEFICYKNFLLVAVWDVFKNETFSSKLREKLDVIGVNMLFF